MAARFTTVHVDDVNAVDWRGSGLRRHPLRGALRTRIAGMSAYSATRAGDELVEGHVDDDGRGHEEVYVVLRGHARFEVDGLSIDAPAGTLVRVDAAAFRAAVATVDDTVVLVVGDDPGFEPAESEWIERARPLIREDPAGAARIIDELEATKPGSPGVVVGRALLALGRGETEAARVLVDGLLAARPSLAETTAADVDLGALLPTPVVRPARTDELHAIRAVGEASRRVAYAAHLSEAELAAGLASWWSDAALVSELRRGTMLVAVSAEGALTGVLDSGEHVIWKLYVRPDVRGRGIGGALVRALLKRVAGDGRDVVLEHYAFNERAGAAYERLGFTVTRTEASTHDGWPIVWRRYPANHG